MNPQLQWEGMQCTNAPEGWAILVYGTPLRWNWEASYLKDGALHEVDGFASRDAARLACEVALIRLGVLPVGEWVGIHGEPDGWQIHCGELAAFAHNDGAWAWSIIDHSIGKHGQIIAEGYALSRDATKHVAETLLRALVADALEREGQNGN